MTLKVCLGRKKTPEVSFEPSDNWIIPNHPWKRYLPDKITKQLRLTFFKDSFDNSSLVFTDLDIRQGSTIIKPATSDSKMLVRFQKSVEILNPIDNTVILTLRRK